MSKQKQPENQKQRFIDTARELDADESGEAFEHAFGKIVPPKQPKPAQQAERKTKKLRK